jgi:hypothetical protein
MVSATLLFLKGDLFSLANVFFIFIFNFFILVGEFFFHSHFWVAIVSIGFLLALQPPPAPPGEKKKEKKIIVPFGHHLAGPPIISIGIEICGDGNFESLGSCSLRSLSPP